MPNVVCPGCQLLLELDPREGTVFACPQCGRRLRLKAPAPRPRPAAAMPVVIPQPIEPDAEDLPPRASKKPRKPTGRVHPLLRPLGGGAMLLCLLFTFVAMTVADGPSGFVAFLVNALFLAIYCGIGGGALMWAVNGMPRRQRVPSINYLEGLCLYPILTAAGVCGYFLPILPLYPFAPKGLFGGPHPPASGGTIAFILLTVLFCIAGWFAASTAAVRPMLGTSWRNAFAIVVRYFGIVIGLGIVLGFGLALVLATLGAAIGIARG